MIEGLKNKKNMPLISILVPCYNCEKYLDSFFNKILLQTYKNYELVMINDGSTDNTGNKIKEKMELFKNEVKIIYREKPNGGIGSAINLALKIMTGDFFCWIDTDNFFTNEYLEENIKIFLENPECNIVRCDGYYVPEELSINEDYSNCGRFTDTNTNPFEEDLFMNALLEKNFHFGCAMIRTREFDRVNPKREIYESRVGQNWQILLPILYNNKAYYINKPMFIFLARKDSTGGVYIIMEQKSFLCYMMSTSKY